jgi:hypothetical protein
MPSDLNWSVLVRARDYGTSANDDTILSKVNLNEFLLVPWYGDPIRRISNTNVPAKNEGIAILDQAPKNQGDD